MTPLGKSREASWRRLLSGRPVSSSDSSQFPCSLCIPDAWIPEQAFQTRANAIALEVAREAIRDAGWEHNETLHSSRVACVIGTSKGPLDEYHLQHRTPLNREAPLPFDSLWPSGPLTYVRTQLGIMGPSLSPVSACATGLDAVLRASRMIEQGDCDFALAGSVDASVNPFLLHSYRRLGILATPELDATRSCKPFDQERSGFVIGEGGAIFFMMRDDLPGFSPEKIYARWQGGVSYNDPAGLTQLDLQGKTLKRLLPDLLNQAALTAGQIDLLHLHGTGTLSNDLVEATAVEATFGKPPAQPWSTASKGAHGHALGAAGSIELAWMLLSLRDGIVPPVFNLENLDSDCPIRPVLSTPRKMPLKNALKLSLGFGGHQIGAIFSRGSRPALNLE